MLKRKKWLITLLSAYATFLIITLFPLILKPLIHFDESRTHQALRSPLATMTAPPLQQLLKCSDVKAVPQYYMHGDFWILTNYLVAERHVGCAESVTYTTHADHRFLDNLAPLLRRWQGPVSVAVFAPGSDWRRAIDAVQRARLCGPDANLVRQWTTFHFYYPRKHLPHQKLIPRPNSENSHLLPVDCHSEAKIDQSTFRQKLLMQYPVNVGRNIAKREATTHFVLASDIELYPSPGFIQEFLAMINNQADDERSSSQPRVYPLGVFEVNKDAHLPESKIDLVQMLKNGNATTFHAKFCPQCHSLPSFNEWIELASFKRLDKFKVVQRTGDLATWEPIFVGTRLDPTYEERLSWEGKSDKMTQVYVLCLLGYEFHILDNAFLVHRPGFKIKELDFLRQVYIKRTNLLLRHKLALEYQSLYGYRNECIFAW